MLTVCSDAYDRIATIYVGSNRTKFVVHTSLLTMSSSFFRAALEGGFSEGSSQTVDIIEEEPKVFRHFVHWLYFQDFEKAYDHAYRNHAVIGLWLFSERFFVTKLQNQISANLVKCIPKWKAPHHTFISSVYVSTSDGSRLRKLTLDWSALKAHDFEGFNVENDGKREPDHYPLQFILDLLSKLAAGSIPESLNKQDYEVTVKTSVASKGEKPN